MLVLGDLGETFSLLFISVTALICPCAIALLASLLAKGASSRGQLRTSQVYCLSAAWLTSIGGLVGTVYIGEGHFGVAATVFYIIAAVMLAAWSGLSLVISTDRTQPKR